MITSTILPQKYEIWEDDVKKLKFENFNHRSLISRIWRHYPSLMTERYSNFMEATVRTEAEQSLQSKDRERKLSCLFSFLSKRDIIPLSWQFESAKESLST